MIVKYTEKELKLLQEARDLYETTLGQQIEMLEQRIHGIKVPSETGSRLSALKKDCIKAAAKLYSKAAKREFSKIARLGQELILEHGEKQVRSISSELYKAVKIKNEKIKAQYYGKPPTYSYSVVINVESYETDEAYQIKVFVCGDRFQFDPEDTVPYITAELSKHFAALSSRPDLAEKLTLYIKSYTMFPPHLVKDQGERGSKSLRGIPGFIEIILCHPVTKGAGAIGKVFVPKPLADKGELIAGDMLLTVNGYKALGIKELGANAIKTAWKLANEFAKANDAEKMRKGQIKLALSFSFDQYCREFGYDIDTESEDETEKKRIAQRRKDAKKELKKNLEALAGIIWEWADKTRRGRGDYVKLKMIGSHSIRAGVVSVAIDPAYALILAKTPVTKVPAAIYAISGRKPTALAVGMKIAQHANTDNNAIRETNKIISVRALLAASGLPSRKEVYDLDRNWRARQKEPLEEALDEITRANVIGDWRYSGPKGASLTDEEADFASQFDWEAAYIVYDPAIDPDSAPRIQRKRQAAKRKRTKKQTEKAKKHPDEKGA